MSLDKKTEIRKKMFKYGGKIVWAPSDTKAKALFDELMKLRDDYIRAGGKFKD
jgi:hypothetical protein